MQKNFGEQKRSRPACAFEQYVQDLWDSHLDSVHFVVLG